MSAVPSRRPEWPATPRIEAGVWPPGPDVGASRLDAGVPVPLGLPLASAIDGVSFGPVTPRSAHTSVPTLSSPARKSVTRVAWHTSIAMDSSLMGDLTLWTTRRPRHRCSCVRARALAVWREEGALRSRDTWQCAEGRRRAHGARHVPRSRYALWSPPAPPVVP